jgi:hypothetical protein
MKGRSLFGLTISLTILCTWSLSVFAQSRQATQRLYDSNYPTNLQAQSTRSQTIQSLPDGKHLYGRVIDPKQPDQRVIFRKIGNRVIAVTYNFGKTECFEGTLNRNTITNTIFPTYSRDGKLFFIGGGLNSLGDNSYRLGLEQVPDDIRRDFQECINVFDNRK